MEKIYLSLTKTAKNSEWIDEVRNSEKPVWLSYYRLSLCHQDKISSIIKKEGSIDVLIRPSKGKDEDGDTRGLYLWLLKVTDIKLSKERLEDEFKKIPLENEEGSVSFWMKVEKITDIKENSENYCDISGERVRHLLPSLVKIKNE